MEESNPGGSQASERLASQVGQEHSHDSLICQVGSEDQGRRDAALDQVDRCDCLEAVGDLQDACGGLKGGIDQQHGAISHEQERVFRVFC